VEFLCLEIEATTDSRFNACAAKGGAAMLSGGDRESDGEGLATKLNKGEIEWRLISS